MSETLSRSLAVVNSLLGPKAEDGFFSLANRKIGIRKKHHHHTTDHYRVTVHKKVKKALEYAAVLRHSFHSFHRLLLRASLPLSQSIYLSILTLSRNHSLVSPSASS